MQRRAYAVALGGRLCSQIGDRSAECTSIADGRSGRARDHGEANTRTDHLAQESKHRRSTSHSKVLGRSPAAIRTCHLPPRPRSAREEGRCHSGSLCAPRSCAATCPPRSNAELDCAPTYTSNSQTPSPHMYWTANINCPRARPCMCTERLCTLTTCEQPSCPSGH